MFCLLLLSVSSVCCYLVVAALVNLDSQLDPTSPNMMHDDGISAPFTYLLGRATWKKLPIETCRGDSWTASRFAPRDDDIRAMTSYAFGPAGMQ